ncbi:MAG: hypothetical protein AAFX55_09830 [Bacteroidota bacterium]
MRSLKFSEFEVLSRAELKAISGGICKGTISCDPMDPAPGCASPCLQYGDGNCGGWRCRPRIVSID